MQQYQFLWDDNYSSFDFKKMDERMFEPLRTTQWEVKFIDQIGVIEKQKPKVPFNVMFNRIINALHNTRIITRNIFINKEYDKQQTYRSSKQHG